MTKKLKIIPTLICFILLISCGFKKINQELNLIYFEEIIITGDKRLSQVLKNNLLLLSNKTAENKHSEPT